MSENDRVNGGDNHEDAELFAQLRSLWRDVDPMPAALIDRMIAAVASEGLSDEYALLTLVEDPLGAVRGDADALTLQFSDGTTSILLHVTRSATGAHRIDGWVDTVTGEIELAQGDRIRTTSPNDTGRFVFDDVPDGLTRVRLTATVGDEERTLSTPQFEL
ncbi:hypothetical protein [Microbacterium hydrocarbonoxydans]|uniref:Carboxypeptidase regulatory-like domain-containing protein n=1 Tax=Microbacterium hydrocarbonoxydans TaxID=273678 RepID=A0A1H4IU88_9MICO|nr:hypothetical protein [Microbacterium hydrocarbonoxydans]SEB36792.1 hypothetical protein SAMN04489807_0209 [Microbacterium hydrocarbonoxydans]